MSGEFGILFDACGEGPPSSSYIIPAGTYISMSMYVCIINISHAMLLLIVG